MLSAKLREPSPPILGPRLLLKNNDQMVFFYTYRVIKPEFPDGLTSHIVVTAHAVVACPARNGNDLV